MNKEEIKAIKKVLKQLNAMVIDGWLDDPDNPLPFEYGYEWNEDLEAPEPTIDFEEATARNNELDIAELDPSVLMLRYTPQPTLQEVSSLDKALKYLVRYGVVDARSEYSEAIQESRERGGYLNPGNEGHTRSKSAEWEVYDIYTGKLSECAKQFGLVMRQGKLIDKTGDSSGEAAGIVIDPALPDGKSVFGGSGFVLHDAYRVSYKGKEIEMTGQVSRVATVIMEASDRGSRTSNDTLVELANLPGVLNVKDNVAVARRTFKSLTGKDHFNNKRNVGYIFKP